MVIARTHGECLRMILQKYLDAAQELAHCLAAERAALAQSDSQQIQSLAEQKTALMQLFDVFADEMTEFAAMAGLSSGQFRPMDITQLIEHCMTDQRDTLHQVWESLTTCLYHCQQQNAMNGAVVTVRANSLQRTLNLLVHGTDDPVVSYDEKGQIHVEAVERCTDEA